MENYEKKARRIINGIASQNNLDAVMAPMTDVVGPDMERIPGTVIRENRLKKYIVKALDFAFASPYDIFGGDEPKGHEHQGV